MRVLYILLDEDEVHLKTDIYSCLHFFVRLVRENILLIMSAVPMYSDHVACFRFQVTGIDPF